ncbi:MAG: lamin tail domain-containing protein, partial [bacterium]|nr:lamin tail domain-containing protein [bacterium]
MQKSFLIILGLVLLVFTPGFAAHLLISEVVVTPSSAEYIEIYNPGPTAVDLTNYYLTDSMDVVGGKPNYTGIVDGTVTPTGAGTDFLVKFPNGATIAPGAYIVISANAFSSQDIPATYKISTYGPSTATPMVVPTNGFVGGSTNGLISNASEAVMLFYWDGTTDTVKDVDYVCWGTSVAYFCDKTGVSTDGPDADSTPTSYLADTPTGNQKPAAGNHAAGYSIQRKQTNPIEVTETFTGGNGLTGHDETSEDFTATASGSFIQSVLRTPGYGMPSDLPPTISGTLYSPGIPTSTDSILIYATVTDDTTGFTVQVKSNVGNYSMSNVSGNLWTAYLPPQPDGTDINF